MNRPLLFTDLDGSLLDHDTYSHTAASPTLAVLKSLAIPVIPTTSKTLAELLPIRAALNNTDPFIVENGAAIYIPVGYFEQQPDNTTLCIKEGLEFWEYSQAPSRAHWQQLLSKLSEQFNDQFSEKYINFQQLGTQGIADLTGLSLAQAALANQRGFSEPIHWLGNNAEKKQFIAALESIGAHIVEGGRFLHLIDRHACKGAAMQRLTASFKENGKHNQYICIAAGDSHNDISMLEAADIAAVIRSPVHSVPILKRKEKTYLSEHFGPSGWNEVIAKILEKDITENN